VKVTDFELLRINTVGDYRLVEESKLGGLIGSSFWVQCANIPQQGPEALAFTLRIFLMLKGRTVSSLAKETGINRGTLISIEKANNARGPNKDTLDALIKYFGDSFKEALVIQGNYKP
jgi:hypothetical protein